MKKHILSTSKNTGGVFLVEKKCYLFFTLLSNWLQAFYKKQQNQKNQIYWPFWHLKRFLLLFFLNYSVILPVFFRTRIASRSSRWTVCFCLFLYEGQFDYFRRDFFVSDGDVQLFAHLGRFCFDIA